MSGWRFGNEQEEGRHRRYITSDTSVGEEEELVPSEEYHRNSRLLQNEEHTTPWDRMYEMSMISPNALASRHERNLMTDSASIHPRYMRPSQHTVMGQEHRHRSLPSVHTDVEEGSPSDLSFSPSTMGRNPSLFHQEAYGESFRRRANEDWPTIEEQFDRRPSTLSLERYPQRNPHSLLADHLLAAAGQHFNVGEEGSRPSYLPTEELSISDYPFLYEALKRRESPRQRPPGAMEPLQRTARFNALAQARAEAERREQRRRDSPATIVSTVVDTTPRQRGRETQTSGLQRAERKRGRAQKGGGVSVWGPPVTVETTDGEAEDLQLKKKQRRKRKASPPKRDAESEKQAKALVTKWKERISSPMYLLDVASSIVNRRLESGRKEEEKLYHFFSAEFYQEIERRSFDEPIPGDLWEKESWKRQLRTTLSDHPSLFRLADTHDGSRKVVGIVLTNSARTLHKQNQSKR